MQTKKNKIFSSNGLMALAGIAGVAAVGAIAGYHGGADASENQNLQGQVTGELPERMEFKAHHIIDDNGERKASYVMDIDAPLDAKPPVTRAEEEAFMKHELDTNSRRAPWNYGGPTWFTSTNSNTGEHYYGVCLDFTVPTGSGVDSLTRTSISGDSSSNDNANTIQKILFYSAQNDSDPDIAASGVGIKDLLDATSIKVWDALGQINLNHPNTVIQPNVRKAMDYISNKVASDTPNDRLDIDRVTPDPTVELHRTDKVPDNSNKPGRDNVNFAGEKMHQWSFNSKVEGGDDNGEGVLTIAGLPDSAIITVEGKVVEGKEIPTNTDFVVYIPMGEEVGVSNISATKVSKVTTERTYYPTGEAEFDGATGQTVGGGYTPMPKKDDLIEEKTAVDERSLEWQPTDVLDKTVEVASVAERNGATDENTENNKLIYNTKNQKVTDHMSLSTKNGGFTAYKGAELEAKGTLKDSNTGKEVLVDGKPIISEKTVTVDEKTSSQKEAELNFDMEYLLNAEGLEGDYVFTVEVSDEKGNIIASGDDLNDKAETIKVIKPELHTQASANGDKELTAGTIAKITDTVEYSNFIPGQEITIKGKQMNKETQKALQSEGVDLEKEITFTPEHLNGTIEVEFGRIKTDNLAGKTLVSFEKAVTEVDDEEVVLATHEDINDEGQSIKFKEGPKAKGGSVLPSTDGGNNTIGASAGLIVLATVAGTSGVVLTKKKN